MASAVAMFTWASCMGIVFAGTVRSAMVQAFAACTLLNSKLFREKRREQMMDGVARG